MKRNFVYFAGADALTQKDRSIIEERAKMEDVIILPSKPSHELQARAVELDEINDKFENLERNCTCDESVVSVFMVGAPASGKTQLAGHYGEKYFKKQLTLAKNIAIVGTLDIRNKSSLWRSYSRLTKDLHCEVQAHGKLKDRLAILKAMVQKKFQDNPGWLLIVDGVNDDSKYKCCIIIVWMYSASLYILHPFYPPPPPPLSFPTAMHHTLHCMALP